MPDRLNEWLAAHRGDDDTESEEAEWLPRATPR